MALVTISGLIPKIQGGTDLWPWRLTTPAGVDREVYPNGSVLTFQVESGVVLTVRNALTGESRRCIATEDTDLWTYFNAGVAPTPNLDDSCEVWGSVATLSRRLSGISADVEIEGSGKASLTFFTADQSMVVHRLRVNTGNQAAADITLAKLALYRVDRGDNISLAGVSAHTQGLGEATWADHYATLLAPVPVVKGERLAFGALFIGETMPRLAGLFVNWGDSNDMSPRLSGALDSVTDFPAHVKRSDIGGSGRILYGRCLGAA